MVNQTHICRLQVQNSTSMSLSEKWVTPKSHLAFLVIVPTALKKKRLGGSFLGHQLIRGIFGLMLRPEAFLGRLCFLIFLCFRIGK